MLAAILNAELANLPPRFVGTVVSATFFGLVALALAFFTWRHLRKKAIAAGEDPKGPGLRKKLSNRLWAYGGACVLLVFLNRTMDRPSSEEEAYVLWTLNVIIIVIGGLFIPAAALLSFQVWKREHR